MLYRQIASQKAALNREKEIISEKLEKKKQKLARNKHLLEETTQNFERVRDENRKYGQLFEQAMPIINKMDSSPQQIGNLRESIGLLTQQKQFGNTLNTSTFSNLNTSMNRHSNIKKTIKGGNGSVHIKQQRSSTMVGGNIMNQMGPSPVKNTRATQDMDYLNGLL